MSHCNKYEEVLIRRNFRDGEVLMETETPSLMINDRSGISLTIFPSEGGKFGMHLGLREATGLVDILERAIITLKKQGAEEELDPKISHDPDEYAKAT